jgi:S1-C subfamily serine protease
VPLGDVGGACVTSTETGPGVLRGIGTVAGMRSWAAAGLAAVAAALGAGAALLAASQTGLGDGATTIVQQVPAPATDTSSTIPRPTGRGFDPAALYAERSPGVVTIHANLGIDGSAQGSGFVVSNDGVILTNAHVITNVAEERGSVRGAQAVYVEFADGERVAAEVVGWDLFSDVGVVRVAPADHALVTLPLGDSSRVVVGEPVAAIGSPFGKQTSLSVGVVSATGRSIDSLRPGFDLPNAIQTDAPINRGNSGGPLFDGDGRVIGINAQIQSTSGTAEGVGFAIPINVARRSLEQLLATGRVRYAYIGVHTQDVTPGLAKAFDLGAERGALVTRVEDGTPAANAGIRGGSRTETYNGLDVTVGGDVIVAIGESEVTGADDVSRLVTTVLRPGQTVPFTVLRGTRRITVDVTLGDRPSGTP